MYENIFLIKNLQISTYRLMKIQRKCILHLGFEISFYLSAFFTYEIYFKKSGNDLLRLHFHCLMCDISKINVKKFSDD